MRIQPKNVFKFVIHIKLDKNPRTFSSYNKKKVSSEKYVNFYQFKFKNFTTL